MRNVQVPRAECYRVRRELDREPILPKLTYGPESMAQQSCPTLNVLPGVATGDTYSSEVSFGTASFRLSRTLNAPHGALGHF